MHVTHKISISKACDLSSLSTSSYYYKSKLDDQPIIDALNVLRDKHPCRGFGVYFERLRHAGYSWNRKRVHRVYKAMGLQIRKPLKKRFPARHPETLEQPSKPMQTWSMDFMSDALVNGRTIRVLNIIDDYNRESIWQEVRYSYPASLVVRALEIISLDKGLPDRIRVDNGPEYISSILAQFCADHGVQLDFIEPGKPQQNAFVERFNRTFREDVLDANLLLSLSHAQELTDEWQEDYNNHHPHSS